MSAPYQNGDNEIKDIPVVFPEREEVVNPLQDDFSWEDYHSEGIDKVQDVFHHHHSSVVGQREL